MENSTSLIHKELYNAAVNGDHSILDKAHNEEYFYKQTYQKNNYLHIAIQHQHYDFIKAALRSFPAQNDGIDKLLCQGNCDGNTPLHVTAEVGNVDILNLLLEYKGDKGKLWRVQNNHGNTPLHVAIIYGNIKFAEVLLSNVEDPQLARDTNKAKETPLHIAVKYQAIGEKRQTIKLFNILNRDQVASMEGRLQGEHLLPIIKLLLEIDSCVACWRDANGLTPLLRGTSLKAPYDLEVAKEILRHQPQAAEVCDHSGKTILHHLKRKLSYQEAKELLGFPEINSLVKYRDHTGDTPVHVAARDNDFNFVRVLLDSSADFLLVNDEGVCAADLLEQNNVFQDNEISEAFAEGISKLTEDECIAVTNLDEEFLQRKLGSEGRVFLLSRAPDGKNILHLLMQSLRTASSLESEGFIVTFVKAMLDMFPGLVCQTDHHGNNPLHYLSNQKNMFVPLTFIASLADVFDDCFQRAAYQSPWRMKNAKGNTPLHESIPKQCSMNLHLTFEIWKRDEEVVCYTNECLETPLHLLANVSESRVALHLALENGHFDLAELYLSAPVVPGGTRHDRLSQRYLLESSNNNGVKPDDLIGSLQHLPSSYMGAFVHLFEEFLSKEGELVGRRSMYGVPMAKIEAYTSTIGVIAALLATVTFTAGFTVPGGLNQENGTPLLMRETAFQVFMVSNLLALCLSIMVLFCLLWIMTTQNRKQSIVLVDTSILLLELSFYATLLTFMTGLYVTTINIVPRIAILSCALCSSLILLMHRWFIKGYLGPYTARLIRWSTRSIYIIKTSINMLWNPYRTRLTIWYIRIKYFVLRLFNRLYDDNDAEDGP